MFVPGKPFQPSLIFEIKAGAFPNEAFFQVIHSRVGFWPYPQIFDQARQTCRVQTL